MSAEPTPIPQRVTTEEAVELVWAEVFAGRADDGATAARTLWHTLRFSDDDYSFLALHGLINLCEREQSHAKVRARPAIGYGVPHGKKWQKYIALTWPYESADGSQKALADFTSDDLASFALYWATQESSARRRREWATSVSSLLEEHEARRIRDLPASVLAQVNEAALEAMGRQA